MSLIRATAATQSAEWAGLKDIRGERHAPFQIPWLWLLAALLAAAAVFAWRKYYRPKTRVDPPKPAHVIAELDLDRLMRAGHLDRGEIDLFVSRLSNILREYIERRFSLHAPQQSTEEFFADLRYAGVLTPERKKTVMDILRQADLVKFAAEWIGRESAIDILGAVRAFIRQTADAGESPQAEVKAA